MEKVIPYGLNYADIKPEAIENTIKLVRFTPVANVQQSKANDVIRFNLQGNGFFDPYSAYIKIKVNVDTASLGAVDGDEFRAKILDRSAHSLIGRLVIRSQGTEIERIEQYDLIAACINDVLYSQEYNMLHHYEGFPCKTTLNYHNNLAHNNIVHTQGRGALTRMVGEPCFYQFEAGSGGGRYGEAAFTYNGSPNVAGDSFDGPSSMTFCIPIYSGILGVLMPDKKLLPLSLMPLEVEFTLNQYAFYTIGGALGSGTISRDYQVSYFEIYAHMLFFEQEVHRSLEAVVAEHGIFIHYNTFYLAPISVNPGGADNTLTQYAQINVHFKSINSVHFVFIYSGFETDSKYRKLHFVSHALTSLQIRNGTELLPSEPIMGNTLLGREFYHSQFLLEMYKGWNKMHDPTTDGSIDAINYTLDYVYTTDIAIAANNVATDVMLYKLEYVYKNLGRCQYAVSMEGEELGQDKSTITGRKGMMPFDINVTGTKKGAKTSYTIPFIRADLVLYVRPDLVVTVLGK